MPYPIGQLLQIIRSTGTSILHIRAASSFCFRLRFYHWQGLEQVEKFKLWSAGNKTGLADGRMVPLGEARRHCAPGFSLTTWVVRGLHKQARKLRSRKSCTRIRGRASACTDLLYTSVTWPPDQGNSPTLQKRQGTFVDFRTDRKEPYNDYMCQLSQAIKYSLSIMGKNHNLTL